MLFPAGVLVLTRLEIPIPRFVQVALERKRLFWGCDVCKKSLVVPGIGPKPALFFADTFMRILLKLAGMARAWGLESISMYLVIMNKNVDEPELFLF